ncbi:MAG TPA: amidohydrolase [Candidatus Acidoferrales bacterium]|nr:amidohydrolase [Candidatus Acidoferrales bacterium]
MPQQESNSSSSPASSSADLVLTKGAIYTGDPQRPRVEAIAVRGEWIVAAGSNDEVHKWIGPKTQVVDLRGAFAMPGFNDAHVHFGYAAAEKMAVAIEGARSLEEFQRRVRDRLSDFTPGEWITGRGWDHTLWPEKRFPTRQDLDAVSRDHPMFFARVDGHVGVANSLALKLCGITRETADPPGGRILHDPKTGEPTGMLEEDAAMDLVRSRIPGLSATQRRRGIELVIAEASRNGITSAQDNSDWADFLVYKQLKSEGKLPLRITEWLPFTAPLDQLEALRKQGGSSDPWLKTGPLKGFLDGSLGSRTAALLAPYADDPGNSGILRMDPDDLKKMAIERDRAGFQIAFHAIGDRANRVALDTFAAVRVANGERDRRDRVEHAQVVAAGDIERFAALDVIASMQPCHLLTDERWTDARLGTGRSVDVHAWNSMKKHGVRLAFGTDYPVEPISPLRGLYACVTRELPEGGPAGGWRPQEKLSIEDCIGNYTLGSAYAQFEEQRKGQLTPGKLADVVVLSADITRIPPHELLRVQVRMTLTGGRIVYEER